MFTQLSANNGLNSYWGGALEYINGKFYYYNGHLGETDPVPYRTQTWVSNDCITFTYVSETPFKDGLVCGNIGKYGSTIYKIGGTRYWSDTKRRNLPRKIYKTTDGYTWTLWGENALGNGRQAL